jgi:hypothetical protein
LATNGTAYYYVTGPVNLYVRALTPGAGPYVSPVAMKSSGVVPTFMGHTLDSPLPTYEPKWTPVFSSWTGDVIPDDKVYKGQDVKIVLPLARWNNTLMQLINSTPQLGRTGLAAGTENFLSIGTLLQRNGVSFELWMRNAFYGTANAAAYPDLEIGKYFNCCNLVGVSPEKLTRDTEKITLMIEANWVQNASTGVRTCFTSDPTYFASLPDAN